MSLDVYLSEVRVTPVFEGNVTHNLAVMATAAGLYDPLWRPEEVGITHARDLLQPLQDGLAALRAHPDTFRVHNPPNGWGDYEGFVRFVERYLAACLEYPDAEVRASR